MNKEESLLFVYNADSGVFNELKDFGKKIIDKESYQCNLCGVTFGLTGMKMQWKHFIDNIVYPTKFIHRDTFYEKYNRDEDLPAVFLKKNHTLSLLISKEEINSCDTLEDLVSLVSQKINKIAQ